MVKDQQFYMCWHTQQQLFVCVCFPAATGKVWERGRYSNDPKKGKNDV